MPHDESVPGLHSFEDSAKYLGGISAWTLRKHAPIGNIRIVRLGSRVFIPIEELERIRREGLPSLKPQASGNRGKGV